MRKFVQMISTDYLIYYVVTCQFRGRGGGEHIKIKVIIYLYIV